MDRNKFHYMSGAALFAGIMAVLSQFAFPVGAVPVTLQTFVCAFAGGVLGWKWGAVSISVWLLLGALGVPIPEPCGRLLYRIYSYGRFQRDIS